MARNYSMKEAVTIIAEGKDFESIMDIGRRYPILMNMVTKVAAKAGNVKISIKNILNSFFIVLLFFFRVLKKLVGCIFLRIILEK